MAPGAHRIAAIETGGCPHAAIREDISANLMACESLTARHQAEIVLVESGGGELSFGLYAAASPQSCRIVCALTPARGGAGA